MTEKRAEEDTNHIVIRPNVVKRKPSDMETPGVSAIESVNSELNEIKDRLFSIIKIVSIMSIVETDYSEEFLSTYENYETIGRVIANIGDTNGEYPRRISEFASNPIRCWMEAVTIAFIALHAFPGNSSITCDVIGNVTNKDDNNADGNHSWSGMCFSTVVSLEAYDWKTHSIELFIPLDGNDESNTMLFVDDEIALMSK